MSDKIDIERGAIVEFVDNANPDDEYFAITFSDRPRVVASSTKSIDELQRKLMATEPGGPTAMLDAVYLAESKLRSARFERKAIVIISDGGDNASRYTLREIKSLVRESDVQIYAIGIFDKVCSEPASTSASKSPEMLPAASSPPMAETQSLSSTRSP